MGLFSSKTIINVSTSINRVIEDKLIPNSAKTGLIKGIFSGDQLVENIMEDLVSSVGVKAERMFTWAKSHYIYGLPHSSIMYNNAGVDVIASVLKRLTGHDCVIEYYKYSSPNNLHIGWQKLFDDYGYDQVTNEIKTLSTTKGTPVYLTDIQLVIQEATLSEQTSGSLEQWGTSPKIGSTPIRAIGSTTFSPLIIDPAASNDYYRVSCVWQEKKTKQVNGIAVEYTVNVEDTFTFDIPTVNPLKSYFQVKYSYGSLTDNGGVPIKVVPGPTHLMYEMMGIPDPDAQTLTLINEHVAYFTYEDGSGDWPELDTAANPEYSDLGSFFPFGYFRYHRYSGAKDDKNSEGYKSSKKLMSFLNMDFQKISESIDQNPGIGDVESALFMMGVPADTTVEIEQRYLFDFFKALYVKTGLAGLPRAPHIFEDTPYYGVVTGSAYDIPTAISVVIQDARFKSSFSMSGLYRYRRVGKLGPIGSHHSGEVIHTEVRHSKLLTGGDGGSLEDYTMNVVIPYKYYQKQITANIYEEIQVWNLRSFYYIWGDYSDSGNKLLVPLDHSITDNYSMADRELLYSRSLHFIFNAKTESKIAWYAQTWFKVVMVIVAIVIAYFGDWGDATALLAAVVAGVEGAALIMAITVLVSLVEMAIVSYVMKLFVKAVGPKIAAIIAVVMVAFAVYDATTFGAIQGAPYAGELLSLSNSLMSAVAGSYKDALLSLKDESDSFGIYAKGQNQILEDAKKLLEQDTWLSPFTIFGEKPGDYYNRTIHSGNIGILGVDAVSYYVDTKLTLPTLDQTMKFSFT